MFRTSSGAPATSGPQRGARQSPQAKALGNGKVPPSKKARGGKVKTLKKPSTSTRSRSANAPTTQRIAPAGSATSGNRTNKVLKKKPGNAKPVKVSPQFKQRGLRPGGATVRPPADVDLDNDAMGDTDNDGY